MYRLKLLGVALAALCATAALASASASAALPEFTGSYPNTVTFASTGETRFENTGFEVVCHQTAGTGSITGPKSLTSTITYKGCEEPVEKVKCTSTAKKGLKEGEIQTEAMNASLVYIAKATKEVGIDVSSYEIGKPKPIFLTFVCRHDGALLTTTARGSVVAPVSSLNVKSKTFNLAFNTVGHDEQSPSFYEGENGKRVNAFTEIRFFETGYEQSTIAGQATMTTGLETEIKA